MLDYIGYIVAFILGAWIGSVWAYNGFSIAFKQMQKDQTRELKKLLSQLKEGGIGG